VSFTRIIFIGNFVKFGQLIPKLKWRTNEQEDTHTDTDSMVISRNYSSLLKA